MADPIDLMMSTCSLVRVTQESLEGDLTDTTTTTTGVRCQITPLTSAETGGRTVVEQQTWRAFFPGDTDLDGNDRIVFDGETFELDGPPQKWPQLGGIAPFLEVNLVRSA